METLNTQVWSFVVSIVVFRETNLFEFDEFRVFSKHKLWGVLTVLIVFFHLQKQQQYNLAGHMYACRFWQQRLENSPSRLDSQLQNCFRVAKFCYRETLTTFWTQTGLNLNLWVFFSVSMVFRRKWIWTWTLEILRTSEPLTLFFFSSSFFSGTNEFGNFEPEFEEFSKLRFFSFESEFGEFSKLNPWVRRFWKKHEFGDFAPEFGEFSKLSFF